VNSFHRDPNSGTLTKSATLTLADEAGFAAMTPDGRFVLVPDTQTGAVNIVAVDGSTGALTLAGTSSSAGAFVLYHFIDATHVLGRLKVNNSDRLTMFTWNGTTLTVGATLDLAGPGSLLLSVTSVGNTIYVANSTALQMIAFDPVSGSLRAIATANTVASSIAVNPVTP
jgi:6-phosphogluconolactonase (cycloisomerase 2 family)